jgi:hypothetical protein
VREAIRYNPYTFSRDPHTLSASFALAAGESYCVPKATSLAACARHCGIPARIGLADVRNHLSTPRLLALLKSDVFAMHGYTELYLNGRWVKATPAFNRNCARCSMSHRWISTESTTACFTRSTARASGRWSTWWITGNFLTCPRLFSSPFSSATRTFLPGTCRRCWATCTAI